MPKPQLQQNNIFKPLHSLRFDAMSFGITMFYNALDIMVLLQICLIMLQTLCYFFVCNSGNMIRMIISFLYIALWLIQCIMCFGNQKMMNESLHNIIQQAYGIWHFHQILIAFSRWTQKFHVHQLNHIPFLFHNNFHISTSFCIA